MKLLNYLNKKNKKYIIFDFDETLFWIKLPWEHCFDPIKNDLLHLDAALYAEMESNVISLSEMENAYISRYGKQAKDLIIENRIQFETTQLNDVLVNEELVPFVQHNPGYILYLWSSNTTNIIEDILKKNSLDSAFIFMATRSNVDYLKPEIEGFEKIYTADTSKDEYLLVGDSRMDERAANAANIDFLQIDYFEQFKK